MAAGAAGTGKGFINKYSDIVLAVVVIAIVGMMIVPLPTFLLDILLTINISLSVIILLIVALHSGRAAASACSPRCC